MAGNFTGNESLLIAAPMLQDYLVDKSTGAPLAAGIVTFWKDNARNVTYKNVYYQVDNGTTPPSYTYVAFNNPLTLSAVGTFVDDNGNDVIPYFYPYDENNNNEADPYYIVVTDANGVLQFTRGNFPLNTSQQSNTPGSQSIINLLPNGQFLAHNNLPNNTVQNGIGQVAAISTGITSDKNNTSVIVAQGGEVGWYFIKPQSSTSTDIITFNSLATQPTGIAVGNPSFEIQMQCSSAGSDAFKDLRVRFNNVNRFASYPNSPSSYTVQVTGKAENANVTLNLKAIHYYGAGGSNPIVQDLGSIPLTMDQYHTEIVNSISFNSNSGETISTAGDDYIELVFEIANPTQVYNFHLTNLALMPGNITTATYPERPDFEVLDKAIAGSVPVPNPNGNDLYLPLILTPGGSTFDHSVIGNIEQSILSNDYVNTKQARLLCDGSAYVSSSYSLLGIPYSRLGNVLISDSPVANIPKFGTGSNFATCYANNGSTSILRLTLNIAGTPMTDVTMTGTTNITSTNSVLYGGISSSNSIGLTAYTTLPNTVLAVSNIASNLITATDGGSGLNPTVNNPNTGILAQQKSSLTITGIAASSLAVGSGSPGKYFNFSVGSNNYFMWFLVNGEIVPAGTGTAIQITLNSTDTAQDVANIIREAFNAFKVTTLNVTGIPVAGSYFAFKTNPSAVQSYFVWYSMGSTSEPSVPGATGIKVILATSGETTATVATKTQKAINSYQYAVPDFRGMFLRGLDSLGTWDIDKAQRWSTVSALSGANVGTFEFSQFLLHAHDNSTLQVSEFGPTGTGNQFPRSPTLETPIAALNITPQGGTETRPVNAAVNFYIRY